MALLPELVSRIEAEERLFAQVAGRASYHGHLKLKTGTRELDVLLGTGTKSLDEVMVIDWQLAPLSEVFFTCGRGDEYELEIDGRMVFGVVIERAMLHVDRGALCRIDFDDAAVARIDGEWRFAPSEQVRLLPRPKGVRTAFRSPLEVSLDPAQQAVVELPADRHVLILGEAGFGKTTVALHRLITLRERAGRPFRAAVIVPTDGLRRLTELMLQRRRVTDIDVHTYDGWASKVAHAAFRDLPKRESESLSSAGSRLKRHPALRPVLEEYVRRRPKPARDEDRKSHSRARARREDLHHLFGDRALLTRVVDGAAGALFPAVIQDVAEHTRIQFLDTTEESLRHVRKDALETVDGRTLDDGTPTEDAATVDVEDYAVMFELERLRAVRSGERPVPTASYDCILLDEAQELAPLELSLVRRGIRANGTIIVAGDAAQQVDETSFFGGWDQVMEELGASRHERRTLLINYRCPPDVTALARHVLDPANRLPDAEPSIARAHHPHAFHQAAWLTQQLRELEADDPSASIMLIYRSKEAARTAARVLGRGLTPRLALDGEFEFRPGLFITCVAEVKGLEFDHVLVPDANAGTWPNTAETRRALYVAVTRATHRLGLVAAGRWSPLL